MGLNLITPTHLILLGVLALLLFGPKRLPDMGRALGSGLREFKHSIDPDTQTNPVESHTLASTVETDSAVSSPEQKENFPALRHG
jgi:sec-independent protein translocase protein TatA